MRGLIHIYCGDGKGKTTAAAGLAVRCAGSGGRVLFFQFLKGNNSSERKILSGIDGIDVPDGMDNMKFVWKMTEREMAAAGEFYAKRFGEILKNMHNYDMIVLDEVIPAVKHGFIAESELLRLIKIKPEHTEIVMTGREPSERLMAAADYITEMKKIKHPFDSGIAARLGIEY